MPFSLHSDSDHQTNNSCTQPLASPMSISSSTHCVSVYPQSPGTHFHCMLHKLYSTRRLHLHLQGKFLHFPGRLSSTFRIAHPRCKLVFPFQMVALNFKSILLMLKDGGSIMQDTLQSQDGINLGDIHFCPLTRTLRMQHLSLDGPCTLLSKGPFMPPQSERPPKLSGMTAILLVFQVDSRNEKITNFTWVSWSAELTATYIAPARSMISSRT